MRRATRTVASWFGIAAGTAGIEHGYFEILQVSPPAEIWAPIILIIFSSKVNPWGQTTEYSIHQISVTPKGTTRVSRRISKHIRFKLLTVRILR